VWREDAGATDASNERTPVHLTSVEQSMRLRDPSFEHHRTRLLHRNLSTQRGPGSHSAEWLPAFDELARRSPLGLSIDQRELGVITASDL